MYHTFTIHNDLKESFPISSQPTNASPPKKISPFPSILGIAAIIFALDQASKFLVVKNIPLHESWSLSPALARIFKFTYITNTGAAFGMFPQLSSIFMIIAIVVIIAIVIFHNQLPTSNLWIRISLGLQLGGAMGNLLDRIIHGFVVDFVDIGFWPIFNLADLSIVVGVLILSYHLWNEEDTSDKKMDRVPPLSEGEKA